MTTVDSLANETFIDIFANLDHRSLYQVALVCRRWRDPAQLALFSVVEIRGQRKAANWVASPAGERFKIREIMLCPIDGEL